MKPPTFEEKIEIFSKIQFCQEKSFSQPHINREIDVKMNSKKTLFPLVQLLSNIYTFPPYPPAAQNEKHIKIINLCGKKCIYNPYLLGLKSTLHEIYK